MKLDKKKIRFYDKGFNIIKICNYHFTYFVVLFDQASDCLVVSGLPSDKHEKVYI